MILKVFAVRDKAVDLFMPPIFLRSEGEAVRALRVAVTTGDHQFRQSPDDYALYDLGAFDEESGNFAREGTLPRFVCELRSLMFQKLPPELE